jgi:hypothetical protein
MLRSLLSRFRRADDPYEDFYLNHAPVDPRNLVVNRMRQAPEGSVFAVQAETHTPEVMASHVKELGKFFGADLTYIADASSLGLPDEAPALPYAVFCLFRSEHDPREAPGVGGNVGAMKGAHATFQLSAIIREYGFHATRWTDDLDALAAAAGIGTLEARGRIDTPKFGTKVHVADVILTDLPVAVDRP